MKKKEQNVRKQKKKKKSTVMHKLQHLANESWFELPLFLLNIIIYEAKKKIKKMSSIVACFSN